MKQKTGHCLCGAVRFALRDPVAVFGGCHCEMCRRWAGSALLAVTAPARDIAWEGEEHVGRYQSSGWAERAWCKQCGSGLWYRVTAEGPHRGNYEIPIGLFDDQGDFAFTREIFIDRKTDAFAYSGNRETLTEAQVLAMYGAAGEGA